MTLHQLIIWTICLSCLSLLARTLCSRHNRGWSAVAGLVLAIAGGTFYIDPYLASLVGGFLWFALLFVPLLGFARVNALIHQERYGEARRIATYLRWLHPVDGWFEQPQILHALELGQQGRAGEAIANLRVAEPLASPLGRNATALLLLMGARWGELLDWIQQHVPENALRRDPYLAIYYLRALGEVGDLNGLLWALERSQPHLVKAANPNALNLARLFALAFCGQTEEVCRLLAEPLASYPPEVQAFWRITAQLAAQPDRRLLEHLERLQGTSRSAMLHKAIAWRLSHPLADPRLTLTPTSRQMLARIKGDLQQEARYGWLLTLRPQRAYATYGLIAVNLAAFAAELARGGSENAATLIALGALLPAQVWHGGEWWRLLSANFLHYGWLHLVTNMAGLYTIGPFVERSLGFWRYLAAYFATGALSMFAFVAIAIATEQTQQLLVGASAAIVGMVGVLLAILLRGWLRDKSRLAAKRLRLIVGIVLLQTIFDLLVPQVSVLAHLLGLGIGFLAGQLFLLSWPLRE